MKTLLIYVAAACILASGEVALSGFRPAGVQGTADRAKVIGKWKEQTPGVKDGALLTVLSVDDATGLLRGTWIPPSGLAGGKEFAVTGWVSSAAPVENTDNVTTLSFSVTLTTYGSITSYTGFMKNDTLFTLWHNVRPNSRYDWDHVTSNQTTFARVR